MARFYRYLFLATLIGAAFLTSAASADSGQSISIGPAIVSLSLKPGTSVTKQLNIANAGTTGYEYALYASPYGVDNPNYQPIFKSLPGFANITSWFSLSPSSGYLGAGSSLDLKYIVKVPSGTAPGSYYAAIFAESQSRVPQADKTQVTVSQRVGTLIYINVTGGALERGSIRTWSIGFFQSPPIKATLKLANSGKLYYVSNINVYFRDVLGGEKYHYVAQKIIVPKVVRSIPVVWPKAPAIGLFKANGTVTIYGQKRLVSRYFLVLSTTAKVIIVLIIGIIILSFAIYNSLVAVSKSSRRKIK